MANVNVRIKNPPDVTKLGPQHSTFQGSTIYHAPAGPTGPIALSYVRNNRVVGYFADAQLAKDAIAFHIQRENEFGSDI